MNKNFDIPAIRNQFQLHAFLLQADIDAAVTAAREAFKRGSEWRKTTPAQRSQLLHKLADLIIRDCNYLAVRINAMKK